MHFRVDIDPVRPGRPPDLTTGVRPGRPPESAESGGGGRAGTYDDGTEPGPSPGRTESAMRTVLRAQAAEARLVLGLCWALLLLGVGSAWSQLGSDEGEPFAGRLATALLASAGAVLFARLQLSVSRGGAALGRRWLAPLVMATSLAPLLWGSASPMLVVAWAAALLQRDLRRSLVSSGLLLAVLVWVFPRSRLAAMGTFADLFFELLLYTVVLVTATRLAVLLDELRLTREVLARRRVDAERERVGRDLHDIMGRTLVAASLRNQAALRALGDRDPAGARELERLHDTIGRGQAQLRELTSGPVVTRLDEELETCRMLCERVQIELAVDVRREPPGEQAALVAQVVRQSVTDLLGHSRATRCRIVLDRDDSVTVVTVTNDGSVPREESPASRPAGQLARAVVAAGGSIGTEHASGGLATRTVRLPIRSEVPA